MNEALEALVVKELEPLGYDLVEFTSRGTKSRPVVDVRIERRDGEGITVNDCSLASRAIEARLDAEELVGPRYVLEVSSPGVERPLRRAAEWRRFIGRQANVNSPVLGGRIEVEIVGLEGESGAEVALLRDKRGEHRVPLSDVTDARLAFHWPR
jgi:ribosome maturation factor RimP